VSRLRVCHESCVNTIDGADCRKLDRLLSLTGMRKMLSREYDGNMTGDPRGQAPGRKDPARYAIYYAPKPLSPLERFGTTWLDRRVPATEAPRVYGFHATLKAPFSLLPRHSVESLREALSAFARRRAAFDAPPLRLAEIGAFIALFLQEPSMRMQQLADDCVREFDVFRASATAAEIERRRSAGLTERQDALLLQWGYPYVLEEWRFHMTLTGKLARQDRARTLEELWPLAEPHCRHPLRVEEIALFEQSAPGRTFACIGRYALQGAP
jgi:hypothetical protein